MKLGSLAYTIAYWPISVFYVLLALITLPMPGRKPTVWVVKQYSKAMVWALSLAGLKVDIRGREHLPAGPFIIAPKHTSWSDGFCILSQFDDVAFVAGNHLEKFPFMSKVFTKIGAIVVDNCGGDEARDTLASRTAQAHQEGRHILIYPEGHLSRAGHRRAYRTGVWHMSKRLGMPVVPVATNLGYYAPETDFLKKPGTAIMEFLPAIEVGLDKKDFMGKLEDAIENRSNELISLASGNPVQEAILMDPRKHEPRKRPLPRRSRKKGS